MDFSTYLLCRSFIGVGRVHRAFKHEESSLNTANKTLNTNNQQDPETAPHCLGCKMCENDMDRTCLDSALAIVKESNLLKKDFSVVVDMSP